MTDEVKMVDTNTELCVGDKVIFYSRSEEGISTKWDGKVISLNDDNHRGAKDKSPHFLIQGTFQKYRHPIDSECPIEKVIN